MRQARARLWYGAREDGYAHPREDARDVRVAARARMLLPLTPGASAIASYGASSGGAMTSLAAGATQTSTASMGTTKAACIAVRPMAPAPTKPSAQCGGCVASAYARAQRAAAG